MSQIVRRCTDADALYTFLCRIDCTLPVPLSQRVNLQKYAARSVQRMVFTIEEDGQIVSAALFYYNFMDQSFAYFDLLGTVPGYEGRGYAKLLMNAAEESARSAGMTEFHLHTNASNEKAVGVYTRRGYEIIATEPKLHMAKKL